MSPHLAAIQADSLRFPRVSGDEPADRFARYLIVEFSPRERG